MDDPDIGPDRTVSKAYPLLAGRGAALLAITMSALNLRLAVTSLSPLLHQIGATFGFGATTIGMFGMLPPACFALLGVLTPALVRRAGLERCAVLAMGMSTAGVAGRALASGTAMLIVLSIVALSGLGIAGAVIPPLVREYFPDRLALVSTGYLISLHLGALIPPLIAVPFAEAAGWRVALGCWAVVAAIPTVLWLAVLRALPAPGRRGDTGPEPVVVRPLQVWHSSVVWNLTVLYGLTSWNVFILFTWLPVILTGAGHSAAYGGAMVSLLIAVSMLGGIGAPSLTLRLGNPMPLVQACAALYAVGYVGLALAPDGAAIVWVVLLGGACTLFIVAQTMINTHSRTPAGSAATSGFVQGVGGAIAILGPVLFGVLHSWTGTWTASYLLVGASLLGIVVAGWRERHHRTLEDDLASPAVR